ncbi:uncharacterized protein LOC117817633 [Notolabrus celidotus]|uniref:uncharacterized protein LOC117817633 n=1 Tax=Notolabrus celidotus TaxID=1203425 RepID=UPI00148F68BA|nr:uncharacterized protein LOC117817633 [Notolabrus celidotus]
MGRSRQDPLRQWRRCIPLFLALSLILGEASGQIRYSISEEIKEGTSVGNIAKDLGLDPTILKARGFRIVSGSADSLFEVNHQDGVLYVNRNIDREEICQRTSVCLINLKTVLENPLEIHYVAVEVLDVNDNAPSFPENHKRLEISESTLPGTKFQLKAALDLDGGVNSVQQYKLSANQNFRLEVKDRGKDGKVPTLHLQSPLDREAYSSHKLILTALDGGKPPKTGTMQILIDVLDVNDNAPVFSKEVYSAEINENSPIGTIILRVNATDRDDGLNGDVSYSFGDVTSKVRELFDVDPSTGEITVKGQLDYEVDDSYEIDIQASDSGAVPLRTEKGVTVNIRDVNDNAPVIEVTSLSNTISEDSRAGTTVALISITDLDSGVNGKVISFVKDDAPFTLTPSIQDNMYAVVTKSELDRENQSMYDVTVVAKDAGEPALTSEKTFRVVVSDVNDNSPQFSLSQYNFYVTENNPAGASVFSLTASDRDEGDNALIVYHILRDAGNENKVTSFLNINPETGDILALKSFDFEKVKKFQFQVVASDSGTPSLSSNVTVNVFILDQNDNPPVILYPVSSNGSAEGVEEIPRNVNAGHLVTKVRAYDADIGYNGWLLFSLQEVTEHNLFALDRYTGQIRTLRSFTETDEAEQKLIILVKDNGNVSLSATATVIVKVVEPKEAFAASDVKSATKDDEESNVTFYLMITLASVSALFIISIIVLIAMQCSKSTDYTSKYLQETNYDGTLCHSIQYRSGDKRYMLVGPRMSIGSTIVPGSHANTLVLPDRRRASTEITMEGRRHPQTKDYVWFAIYFSSLLIFGKQTLAELRYSIPEEMKEGTLVGNVAKDLGLDKSSLIERRFRVVSGSNDPLFKVNPDNGALQISRKIDREELCEGSGACAMELKIVVENPLEIHYVAVEITDINDHAPRFTEKEQQFNIAEHTSPGTRFQLHAARDPDAGVNSIRTYTLTSNDLFEIEFSQNDEDKMPFLVLKKPLDREQKDKHVLIVTAVDGGKPQRSGTLNVSIIVLDSNDNRPVFSEDTYQIEIYENTPVGTTVFSVSANDADEGRNGEVEYSLSKALARKVYDIFELDSSSGQIKLKGVLDYEESDIYKLDIQASDKGTPPLMGRCRVILKLKDVNDNPPEIEITSLSNTVPEDSKPGTIISLISVMDKDSGVNGKIITGINTDVPFELKPSYKENTYSIVTKGLLDREQVSYYEITIKATDCGDPPLSTFKTLSIQISDVNDNRPHFEQNPLQFYLVENNVAGASIFSVRATDNDVSENAAISYHIVREGSQNDVTSFLNVNTENGHITALKSFDFETVKKFQFQVVATDSGNPSLSSNVTVNVFILDQNDNAPVILYPVSSNGSAEGVEEIPRNVNAGHLVTKVRAYDADIGYNGWLLFSLQEVTEHNLFALDRYTGQIRTLRSFTETDEAEQKLIILVKDNGNVSLSATATVIVKVVEPKEAFAASDVKSATKDDEESNVTFYLMITLASVSALFIISIIVLIAMQCSKSTDYTSKYLQETNYDGTLCHSIQYRSGDKRYMLVGPRMSIGSTIVPGSHANTLVLPDRRRASTEVRALKQCEIHSVKGRGFCWITMKLDSKSRGRGCSWFALRLVLLLFVGKRVLGEIRYSVPEEVKEGTVVGNIAKDLGLDIGSLFDRRFRVVSESKDALFEVNRDNGAMYVHKKIDREELCQDGSGACIMELKIIVENPLEIHYVVIEITDVNDHSPSFPEKAQIFEIGEQTLPGKRFQLHAARDPDAGVNSIRTYTLTTNEHFELDIRQSDEDKIPFLVLKKSLDREQKDKHALLLTAVDGGKPQRSGTLNVTIIVLDSNDNRPVFNQEIYQIEIQENVAVGTSIFRVNATDPDEGSNGLVEYSLGKTLKKKVYDIFELNKLTGEIKIKGLVDFEENDVYKLDVEASDKGTPPLAGECRVIIKIKDINDNPPEIEVTSLSNTVPEDSKPGSIVSLIRVKDKDSGVNGKIITSINNDVPFELKPSYKENTYSIVTKGLLDREQVSHYEITIKATDCGDPPLSTYKTLSIQISDVNDNRPHFQQNPLQFYLVENNVAGASIFSVSATDNDVSENAAISYHIVREGSQNDVTSFLNVNSENGHITALKSFDFETVKTFQFQVVASDSGTPSLSSNVTVNVFILDQNDNPPVILYPVRSNGSAEGVEEIPRNVNAGHLVTKVRAYDADIGYNGWLLFSLQEVTEHNLFALDRYTGQIRTLRSFTETDEAEQKLIILVKDNGNVSLSATATVIVKVVEPKEAFAASDVKSATKDDEESNVTFYLMITLASVSALFIISIIVLIAMQCSKSTDYTSKYLQETNYDGTLCHSIQYRSGDKRYMLVGPRMSIGSTIVPGSHANTLVLPDRRRASTEYYIGKYHESLSLPSQSFCLPRHSVKGRGFCWITMKLDSKSRGKGCSWFALRLVLLLFVGKRVLGEIRYSVPEEVKEGTVVGNVAKDLGLDISSLFDRRLRVVSESKDASFEVNRDNGALYVHKKIDREELCQDGSGACIMELKVIVENPLEIHYVVIEITDVNDHAPSFPEREQLIEIFEHTLPGRRFQLHAARDPDAGVNSIRTYTLTTNEHFELDIRQSDEDKIPFLVLKKSLDREQKVKHTLLLTAVDGGKPQRSGTLNVTVIVLDTNDNRPMFSQEIYQIEIQENVAVGTSVFRLNATDPDEGFNGLVEYSLVKTLKKKVYDIFELNKLTGEIKVKGLVDFEENDIYKLDVEASDKGAPPLSGECRVIIKVKDINDNPPEIEVTSLSNTVPEDSKPGSIVSLIRVKDKDSGVNGKIITSINNDVPFELKPSYKENTYSIVTKGLLDREQVSHYEITIKATDCGDPPLSTYKTLSIQISDVNDNRPHFQQNALQFYLVENNVAGASIFSVSATDNDVSENAAISYHIVREGSQNDATSFLNVNTENGHITALKSFDFETVKKFQFQVVASDSGTPSLSSNVTVNVFILDQNDNAPVILYPVSSNGSAEGVEEIPRNVNVGHLVTKVRAYDADIGYNGWLLFSLQEVTEHNLFALDRYTGQIRTLRSFTEKDEAEQKLIILVKDNGNVSLSATATVIVKVVEPKEAFAASDVKSATKDDEESNVTFYLMITLASVSALFIISIIVLIAMQCSKSTDYTSKYLQETNYDGTLCHSIQYRSGDKRYMLVGPRMSIGSTIVPGSHANTLVLPDRRRASTEQYKLSHNEHFRLEVKDRGEDRKTPSLVLQKPLDRESAKTHVLLLTAIDGGKPPRSGNMTIIVDVLDVNDNPPLFTQESYTVQLKENSPLGTTVIQVNATDLDEGLNGEVVYSFGNDVDTRARSRFDLNPVTGVLTVAGEIDFEECSRYEIDIQASDKAVAALSTDKSVIIHIIDVNDNAPEIEVTSFSRALPEDSKPGTTVALISVKDSDSGLNGKVMCYLSRDLPFTLTPSLQSNMYSLVTKVLLDREQQAQYYVTITGKDAGEPSLSSNKTIKIDVTDVNDNSPVFSQNPYTFYITENNNPGASILSVTALDNDEGSNALISYHIKRLKDVEKSLASFLNINPETGDILALKSFDFETVKKFQFQIVASDSGTPSLSSNVTVNVFILDQNDNAPVILYPVSSNGSAEGVEEIPRNVNAGHLVTKVRAYDADIGYNGWLLFSLQEVTEHNLFALDRYTGQIRTLRSFTETDEAEQKLIILVKDNGNVSLSATATVIVKVVEPKEAFAASDVKSATKDDEESNVTFYLMITLASVSALFVISIIVLIAMQCSKSTDYTSKYLQETNYDGTLCHSIQYRSGDKRYMLVGPRMSIGSTIVPGSHANTLVLPDRRRASTEVRRKRKYWRFLSRPYPEQDFNFRLRATLMEASSPFSNISSAIAKISDWKLRIGVRTFQVVASDSGTPSLSSNVTVNVFILDQNDNAPVILYPVSSNGSAEGVEEIPRNVNAGHLVTKVRAYDADIGYNGWLLFSLQEVTEHNLFALDRYTGQIRTLRSFTETDEAEQKLIILVKDNGNVSLSATATVIVKVVEPKEAFAASDVKSATKDDEESNVTFYLMITLASVSALFIISIIVLIAMQCSKSTDYTSKYLQETNYDGTLCHSIQYRSGDKRYMLVGPRMSIGSTIVPGSQANTLVLPDRRRASTEFQVVASDSGTPSLSSNVTVNVFILDQNDNAPVILYPVSSNGSADGVEEIPRNVNAGHLVTKVRAYDADIGYNGWLLFSLQEVTEHNLFSLDRYTGQIRTLRSFTETDEAEQKLVILVKDNGNVSLSATATVIVKVVEPKEAFAASDVKSATKDDEESNVTFYLMITLASVSALFIISIIVLIAMQCSKSTDYTSKYLQETNYDGTLCHSIQYRSGDKRYMLVGPRMSIGSTIVPGSHANTLVLPDRRRASTEF